MRSMVEGYLVRGQDPSTIACGDGPPPQASLGRI